MSKKVLEKISEKRPLHTYFADSNEDKCYEWLMENKDENTIVKLNERDGLYGIGERMTILFKCNQQTLV